MTLAHVRTLSVSADTARAIDAYARRHGIDSWSAADVVIGRVLDIAWPRILERAAAQVGEAIVGKGWRIPPAGVTALKLRALGVGVPRVIDDLDRFVRCGCGWAWEPVAQRRELNVKPTRRAA